jgi:hypothetical protein
MGDAVGLIKVMRRCAILLVLVAFIFSSGGEWAVLQCVAWGNMIREYSAMVPLSQAVQMTFSGEYPCALCKVIAEKKQSENVKMVSFAKHEKLISTPAFSYRPRMAILAPPFYFERESFLLTRSDVPPTPPPRVA